jgi:DNA-binding LacI/PurR family transcriptional regulator
MNKLKGEIASGRFKPGDKMFAIGEIVEKYDVSTTTAVRCINMMKEDGILKSIPRKGTFVCGVPDVSIEKTAELKRIVLVAHNSARAKGNFINTICQSVIAEAYNHGLDLKLENINKENLAGLERVPFEVESSDGIITVTGQPSTFMMMLLNNSSLRRVSIDSHFPNSPCVLTDNYHGMGELIGHLKDLGHERIAYAKAFFDSPNTTNENERAEAYEILMKNSGSEVIVYDKGSIEETAAALKEDKSKPTALMFSRDDYALRFIKAAENIGIKIPRDLSVTGFDRFSLRDSDLSNLTTYEVALQELGRHAVEDLINQEPGKAGNCRWLRVKGKLIKGNTTSSI